MTEPGRRSSDPVPVVFWGGYDRKAPMFAYDHLSRDCPHCGPRVVFFRSSRTRDPLRCRGCGHQEPRAQYEPPAVVASSPLPQEPTP